jgi:purine-nucleoside phosphorylase
MTEDQIGVLHRAVETWERRGWPKPAALVVSGSGLGVDLFPAVRGPVPLADVLPFPVHALQGHEHRMEVIEPVAGRPVIYLRGRLHSYQGHDASEVVFPVRLAALLGAKVLLMTNAAGGLDPEMEAGDLTLVTDHLNLTGLSPLKGNPPPHWGPRFPDMTEAYSKRLRSLIRGRADALGVPLGEGVYAGVAGPSFETPAEVRMLRTLGGDLVGMSTVLEVIAGHHMGLECAVVSLVANLGAGLHETALTHDEVTQAGAAAGEQVERLLGAVLAADDLLG